MVKKDSLEEQVVVITGCSSGIGLALAREFQKRGHRTFGTVRRLESLEGLKKEEFESLLLDVTRPESISKAVSDVIDRAKRVDILVNNAGFTLFGPVAEMPLDQARLVLETNVMGPMAVSQAVFGHMADRRSGRIVNIGSVAGLFPSPFSGPYHASKAAVHMLSEVFRIEAAPFGIDVVVVQPGQVRSKIADSGARGIERYRSEESHYSDAYSGIEKRAYASQDNPMEAEAFAEAMVTEVTKVDAPRIVRLGAGSDTLPKLANLPGPDLDRMMTDLFGLDALKKE